MLLHSVSAVIWCTRSLQEMMKERGITVDHSTLDRWVIRLVPELGGGGQHKPTVGRRWRMADMYIKVRGQWKFLYRAVNTDGQRLFVSAPVQTRAVNC
ncbi:IS6 family transposase [Erwinia psidii]|nr:IS6 family transposase [Erwinia psidii]